ncbi:PilX N-terminal domain-containing pilus assembly protein [Pokkaliibacter sp. CJK22405]|uniref:pilus assembly PilX family protein n=1 Tax=Pokkaliibacter sp. CJK22405 TaxID=3384615 RepID=UPI0039847669
MHKRQRGAALMVTLVLMILLMVIGIAGYNMTTLQGKIETNREENNLALTLAESALRAGEEEIVADQATGTGVYTLTSSTDTEQAQWNKAATWTGNNTDQLTRTFETQLDDIDPRLKVQPRYIIEVLPEPDSFKEANSIVEGHAPRERMEVFRITSEGTGPSGTLKQYLQSTYSRIVTE